MKNTKKLLLGLSILCVSVPTSDVQARRAIPSYLSKIENAKDQQKAQELFDEMQQEYPDLSPQQKRQVQSAVDNASYDRFIVADQRQPQAGGDAQEVTKLRQKKENLEEQLKTANNNIINLKDQLADAKKSNDPQAQEQAAALVKTLAQEGNFIVPKNYKDQFQKALNKLANKSVLSYPIDPLLQLQHKEFDQAVGAVEKAGDIGSVDKVVQECNGLKKAAEAEEKKYIRALYLIYNDAAYALLAAYCNGGYQKLKTQKESLLVHADDKSKSGYKRAWKAFQNAQKLVLDQTLPTPPTEKLEEAKKEFKSTHALLHLIDKARNTLGTMYKNLSGSDPKSDAKLDEEIKQALERAGEQAINQAAQSLSDLISELQGKKKEIGRHRDTFNNLISQLQDLQTAVKQKATKEPDPEKTEEEEEKDIPDEPQIEGVPSVAEVKKTNEGFKQAVKALQDKIPESTQSEEEKQKAYKYLEALRAEAAKAGLVIKADSIKNDRNAYV